MNREEKLKRFGYWSPAMGNKAWPKDMLEIAEGRTLDLLSEARIKTVPIQVLIESAYLQGVMDGAQAVKEVELK